MQLAIAQSAAGFVALRDRMIAVASDLDALKSIPAVQQEIELIQELQSESYWQGVTLSMIEKVRRSLRGLIVLNGRRSGNPVYTVLTDEIGAATSVTLDDFGVGINTAQCRKKVEAYIRANANHLTIAKLRHNKPLTPADLDALETLVFNSEVVEIREHFEEIYGHEKSLPLFIRSLVGMDRAAAKEAFGAFLDDSRYTSKQIRFVEMIIDRLTANGPIDTAQLYEQPFTAVHHKGLDGVFGSGDAEGIVRVVEAVTRAA